MTQPHLTRRTLLAGTAAVATLGASRTQAQIAAPKSPVALTIIDVGGGLAMTRQGFDEYAQTKPNWVSKITYNQGPAAEMSGKIKAQQDAGRVDIDIVQTGTDSLAQMMQQKQWTPLLPDHQANLPNLKDIYLPGAWAMQELAQGFGVCVVFSPSGPLFEYNPQKINPPPTSVEELLDWTRQNPKRFLYGRPNGSWPGRNFMQGLPYILGDKDPKDPKDGWDKTWAYLIELGKNVEYYPAGTGVIMKEFAEGSRDMILTTVGWDINPRALGVVPKEMKTGSFKNFHWVTDAQFVAVPRGVSLEKINVIVDLINFMLTKKVQAYTYDKGYFYPGPAVKDVALSLAPPESQAVVKEFGRSYYDELIAKVPMETQLAPERLVYALRRWDEQVGARVGK